MAFANYRTRRLFGEVLVDKGLVESPDIHKALYEQQVSERFPRPKIGEILVRTRRLSQWEIAPALAEQLGLELVVADFEYNISADVLAEVFAPVAALYRAIPIRREGDALVVVSADPESIAGNLERLLDGKIVWAVASKEDISKALAKCYQVNPDEVLETLSQKSEPKPEDKPKPVPSNLTHEELCQEIQALKKRVADLESCSDPLNFRLSI